jgi:FtsZ-binding cell division protein ZapB
MVTTEEMDQFQVLETRVDSLIKFTNSLKKEKESLLERLHILEGKLADLTTELETLKGSRDKAKQRVLSLLEKLEQIEITH